MSIVLMEGAHVVGLLGGGIVHRARGLEHDPVDASLSGGLEERGREAGHRGQQEHGLDPPNAAARLAGSDRSPATTSAAAGRPALAGSRVSARTGLPAATNCSTIERPTGAVAAVTRIMGCPLSLRLTDRLQPV